MSPIRPENRDKYHCNWKTISERIRFDRAGNCCEVCGAKNYQPHPETKSRVILTVAHLDHDPTNNAEENLKAMCQRCHNRYDREHRSQTRKARKARQ